MSPAESEIGPPRRLGHRLRRPGGGVLRPRARQRDGGSEVRGRGAAAVPGVQSPVDPRGPPSLCVEEGHDPRALFASVPPRSGRPVMFFAHNGEIEDFGVREGKIDTQFIYDRFVDSLGTEQRPIAEFKQAIAKAKATIDMEFPRKVESYTFLLID